METPLMWTLVWPPHCQFFSGMSKSFSSVLVNPFMPNGMSSLLEWYLFVIAVPEKISKHLSFKEAEQSNVTDVSWCCENNSVGKKW